MSNRCDLQTQKWCTTHSLFMGRICAPKEVIRLNRHGATERTSQTLRTIHVVCAFDLYEMVCDTLSTHDFTCVKHEANRQKRQGVDMVKTLNDPCNIDVWSFDLKSYVLQAVLGMNVWCKFHENQMTARCWKALTYTQTDGQTDGQADKLSR